MSQAEPEHRSSARQVRDEAIAAEPKLAAPPLPAGAAPAPLEAHPAAHRPQPIAVAGVVENGVVRPLDPAVRLPEHARVIIVAPEKA